MSSVELKNAGAMIDDIEKRLHIAGLRGLRSAAARGVQILVTRIIPSRSPMPVDRATYKSGWRSYGEIDGAVIENAEPHALFIEDGVRASNVKLGRAMLTALEGWIVRKGIASADDAKGIAFAIAKSMQRRGIFRGGQGLGILAELIDKDLPRVVEEEVAAEIAREFGT